MEWALVLAQLADALARAAGESSEHSRHVEQVHREAEAQSEFFLQLFKSLAEAIREKLGHEALGPELAACLDAFDPIRVRDLVDRVDGLVARGKEPEVVRELQALTGFTWDEVFDLMSRWESLTTERRARLCTMLFMRKALASRKETS